MLTFDIFLNTEFNFDQSSFQNFPNPNVIIFIKTKKNFFKNSVFKAIDYKVL